MRRILTLLRLGVATGFFLSVPITALAAPFILSDTIQIGNTAGAVLASQTIGEGPGTSCSEGFGPTPITFQCEHGDVNIAVTFPVDAHPADALIFLTHPDGSVSDVIDVGTRFPGTSSSQLDMVIYSDVEGFTFPSLADFIAANPNAPHVTLGETGSLQDITALAYGLLPPLNVTALTNYTLSVQSDVETVPEPATLTLTVLGLAGAIRRYHRRRTSR
jgi:hypothetical protein